MKLYARTSAFSMLLFILSALSMLAAPVCLLTFKENDPAIRAYTASITFAYLGGILLVWEFMIRPVFKTLCR